MDVTTELPAIMPRRRADVLVAEFDGELVVLVPGERMAHHLDAGLSLVLDSCDGSTPTADVVAEIAGATGDGPDTVRVWLHDAMRQLAELQVLESASSVLRPGDLNAAETG